MPKRKTAKPFVGAAQTADVKHPKSEAKGGEAWGTYKFTPSVEQQAAEKSADAFPPGNTDVHRSLGKVE